MKIPCYVSILLLVVFMDSGNQVHMAVVPEYVHCDYLTLRNDYCDIKNDPCDAHCKVHYRSTNVTGSCDIDINLCVCTYCHE
ncbi:hypothetical protein AAZX31_15G233600 [Glycine max]|uniref:Knottin scorpion toxin-like domain-containing protein n=1 Tax=Glycine max TaxID=3847 RepID=K7MDT5_SOYBN|nr:hypothetical protein GLYMA_15G249200v4 [Glycine max]